MIPKILFILFILLSITFSQQNKSFTISGNSQGGFNIINSEGGILFEFTKNNTDSLSIETLRFIFSELKYFQNNEYNQISLIKEFTDNNSDSGISFKDVFSYLSGILLLWVGWLQYKLNKIQSIYNLYDKKFNVYENTAEYLNKLLYGWIDISDCTDFDKKVRIAKFICNDKINNLLNEILTRGFKIASLNIDIKTFTSNDQDSKEYQEKKKRMKEKSDLLINSKKYRDDLDEIFSSLKVKE